MSEFDAGIANQDAERSFVDRLKSMRETVTDLGSAAVYFGMRAGAVVAASFATAAAVPAAVSAEGIPGSAQDPNVALCEQDAQAAQRSFSYEQNNQTVKWKANVEALPQSCKAIVRQTVSVQELIGTNSRHLVANTSKKKISDPSGGVHDRRFGHAQRAAHRLAHGDFTQGKLMITATPTNGAKPKTFTTASRITRA